MTTQTTTAHLPKRDEVETFEDHAADYLETWLKANAPDIFELWTAHLDLVMYRTLPERGTPEHEELMAQEAARNVETVLRVAGPLPEPKPTDQLYMQLMSAWKHMTDADKATLAAIVGDKSGAALPLAVAGD